MVPSTYHRGRRSLVDKEFMLHRARRVQMASAGDEDDNFLDEAAKLLARMDQGLYSLQQCALIVGHLWFVGDIGVRRRILQLLHQKASFTLKILVLYSIYINQVLCSEHIRYCYLNSSEAQVLLGARTSVCTELITHTSALSYEYKNTFLPHLTRIASPSCTQVLALPALSFPQCRYH